MPLIGYSHSFIGIDLCLALVPIVLYRCIAYSNSLISKARHMPNMGKANQPDAVISRRVRKCVRRAVFRAYTLIVAVSKFVNLSRTAARWP